MQEDCLLSKHFPIIREILGFMSVLGGRRQKIFIPSFDSRHSRRVCSDPSDVSGSSLLSSRTLTIYSNSPMGDIEKLILDERCGGIGDIH